MVQGVSAPGADAEQLSAEGLVRQVALLADIKPDSTVSSRLVDLLIDAVGTGVAGGSMPVARSSAEVLGTSDALWDRAWLYGICIHALDFDDTHESSLCHTGAALVPGLLAIGRARNKAGSEVLAAFDFGLRFVEFLSPYGPRLNEMGVHSTGVLGTLGAAAACSWLINPNAEQTAAAIELASLMATGLGAAFGTDAKPVQAGRAAEAGLRAAMLVNGGIGAPADALFGPRGLVALWLGEKAPSEAKWGDGCAGAAHGVAMKPYPACFLTHSSIDAALELRGKLGIESPDMVQRVEMTVHPISATIADKVVLATATDTKFSLRYCLRATFQEGAPVLATFTDSTRTRLFPTSDSWDAWVGKIEVRVDRSLPRLASRVTVETTDGRRATAMVEAPYGSIGKPLSHDDVVTKFNRNVEGILEAAAAADLLQQLLSFEATTDVGRLQGLERILPQPKHSSPV